MLNKTNGIGFNDTQGPYIKIGIYKRKWDLNKSWGGPTDVSSRTTYIDDFKIGDANATYDEMVPNCSAPMAEGLVIRTPTRVSVTIK